LNHHRLPAITGGIPAFEEPVPFMRPTMPAFEEVESSLAEIFRSGRVTKGKLLEAYEDAIARHLGTRDAVAVSSCTVGLMITLQSLALEGEVIVPSFTFFATVNALIWNHLTPVFVDCDPLTWNLDPGAVEAAITSQTSAILGVHIFGNPADIAALERIANRHGLALIFDAAHGFGSLYQGKPVGRYGTAEVFSTSPTKLLVTGEGGIIATDNPSLAEKLRIAREYGNPGDYDCILPGINARLSEMHALLGLKSLEMLEMNARRRNHLASLYRQLLSDLPGIAFQKIATHDRCSFKELAILIDPQEFGLNRDQLATALEAERIDTRKYFYPPVHRQKAYHQYQTQYQDKLPHTDRISQNILSLPMFSQLSDPVVEQICQIIRQIYVYRLKVADHLRPVPPATTAHTSSLP